ncbi:hypothetical protein AHAS_Ahas10G0024600 [Arachis hypogaea]
MEVPAQNIVTCDEEKALKCLLDAFGSVFSLEEIASAYCKASRNADLAGEMLYEMKGTSSSSSSHSSNADARVEETSGTSDGYSVENSSHERKNLRAKARSVSVGTVSGTIGRDYVRPVPSANGDRTVASNKGVESHQKQKHKDELQKEILSALFKGYQRCEEAPKKTVKDLNNSSRYKHVVFEPPEDTMEEYKIDMDFSLRDATNGTYPDVEDEDYQCVRRAVKEYRATMNEYYKAAVDAFANGDKFKAEKLIDQGNFFLKKAREADEESSRMIVEPKTSEAQEMLLDLHDHGSREAIRLLKCHLSSLAGIPSFEYLKVIIDASNQENTKGSRRRAILKLLEQEAIKWIEGETAGTILIRLDSIDRKKLSFLKT